MKNLFSLLKVIFLAGPLWASPYARTGFWKQPTAASAGVTKLAFTSAANTGLSTWACTGVVTVQAQNASSVGTNVTLDTAVNLTGPSGVHFYSDPGCYTEVTSVTIPSGSQSASVYFMAGKQGNPVTLTAASTGLTSATQNQTVTSYLGCTWLGTTSNAWGTTTNWSCGHVPVTGTTTDIAVFDANCVSANCSPATLTANQTPRSLWLTKDYVGTIRNGAKTLGVNAAGFWRIDGGTFQQGSASATLNGYIQTGGLFDASAGGASISIKNLTMYGGTFTMNPTGGYNLTSALGHFNIYGGTFNMGNGTFSMGQVGVSNEINAGTFNANNGTINIIGGLTVDGVGTYNGGSGSLSAADIGIGDTATVTLSSGTTTDSKSWTIWGTPTFSGNGGTLVHSCGGTCPIVVGSETYANVSFIGTNATYNLTGTMTVNGNLLMGDQGYAFYEINGGTINVYGTNLTSQNYGYYGSTIIVAAGNPSGQTISSSAFGAPFPNLTINAGSNPVTFGSSVHVSSAYTVQTVGTFNISSSTLYLGDGTSPANITPGAYTYGNVSFQGYNTDFELGGNTLNVGGTLTLSDVGGANNPINAGAIHAYGNVSIGSNSYHGTAIFTLAGNGAGQTISSISGEGVPNLIVAAGANAVTMSGDLSVWGGYTYQNSGTFTATGSTLRLIPISVSSQTIKPGAVHYNNVVVNGWQTNFDFNGETFYVDGTLAMGDQNDYTYSANNGTFIVKGNFTGINDGYGSGSALVKLVGNASGQTVSGGAAIGMVNLEIDTSPSNVTISGSVNLKGNYKVTSVGTLTTTGSTVVFDCNSLTQSINPLTEVYNNLTFAGWRCNANLNSATLRASGTVSMADGAYTGYAVSSGTINISGTGSLVTTSFGKTGNAAITFSGSNQAITQSATGDFPTGNMTVALSGTLTLNSAVNLTGAGQSLSVTSGTITMNNKNLTIANTLTLSGGTSITRGTGTLKVNGSTIGAGAYGSGTIF